MRPYQVAQQGIARTLPNIALPCADAGAGDAAAARFDAWLAGQVSATRYRPEAPGRWLSHLWIEPVLAVQKTHADGVLTLRIVETRLET